jgi:acyl-coenzyme A synthetase/AMP-(fatty) acid ligase
VELPSIRRVISAGAPVPAAVLERFSKMLRGDAQIFTPYGATESLPVTSIGSREILEETAALTRNGKGVCVGRAVDGMEVEVIRIADGPLDGWSPDLRVPLGDLGYLDASGRLWFCGRKAHRVKTRSGTLFTIPCEAVFNAHPDVFRTALVGVGPATDVRPILCVELEEGSSGVDRARVERELLALGAAHPHTKSITTILFHPSFPVDVRHNTKIFREKLAAWAARQLR